MSNDSNKSPVGKFAIIGASVASAVLLVIGTTADFFELGSELGWWRLLIVVTLVSLLVAGVAAMREILRLRSEFEAMKRKRSVEYLNSPSAVFTRAASLLDDSKSSLDYYGGLNLINADAGEPSDKENLAWWRNTLSRRLKSNEFAVTRYIDFILPSELAELYDEQHVPSRQIAEQVAEYTRWIDTQRQALGAGADGNAFYNLRGAPIWQWGMHVLVFDRLHVMLVFTNTRRNYRALVLTNDSETANDIHQAFAAWHLNLKRRPITLEQLQAAVDDGEAWVKEHPAAGSGAPSAVS